MKKNNKETTVANEVKVQTEETTVANNNEVKVQTAAAVNEKASRAQLALIGKAVKDGKIERFTADVWKNMTKNEASQIITNEKLTEGLPANLISSNGLADKDSFATYSQKKMIGQAVREGKIPRFEKEAWNCLTREEADKIIKANNLGDMEIATAKQKEKISALVKDGFLNRFPNTIYQRMSHQEASKFISIGLARQQRGEKAKPYTRTTTPETNLYPDDVYYDNEVPF